MTICRGLLILISILITACSSQEQADFNLAQKEVKKEHYRIAIGYFDQVIRRNKTQSLVLEALRESARLSFFEIQDYPKAINYYRQIVLKSPDANERLIAQKQVAQIYFDNLQDYKNSVVEFSKLMQMRPPLGDGHQYRANIARSWFYTNNFFQSLSEVESLLKERLEPDLRFEMMVLKSNILVAQKNFKDAATILTKLIEDNPEKSAKESVILTLAVCYEENYDFKQAIQVLEKYRNSHNQPEYIDIRIKRLKERMKNAPGARGMRK